MQAARFKYILLWLILLSGYQAYAQTISGTVIDKNIRQPVGDALMTLGPANTRTNKLGVFQITVNDVSDSLKITHLGYKGYAAKITKATPTLYIELEPAVISLNTVSIKGERNFKQDSINNRLQYAKQFNYHAPKLKDIISTGPKQPGELLSINLLTLVDVLIKKSTPQYKFNKILLRDEQADYIDHKFNRGIVLPLTGLKGDTLSAFVVRYRPTFAFAQKASDYDMINYIKKSCEEFRRDGVKDGLFMLKQN